MPENYLEQLGFYTWDQPMPEKFQKEGWVIARVLEVNKNSFTADDGIHTITSELSGKFLYNSSSPTSLPTTGY